MVAVSTVFRWCVLACFVSLNIAFCPNSAVGISRKMQFATNTKISPRRNLHSSRMQAMRPEKKSEEVVSNSGMDLKLSAAVSSMLMPAAAFAAAPEWVEPVRSSLDIGLAILSLFFFIRIPMSWYPQMDIYKMPQAVVSWPTEPLLKLVRGITPPLFGVDISPVVVYAVLSFIREICLGQQGLLTMMANKA